ncbi:unnamed protein product [Schistosoma margrebowiei]|uniref:Uncharacterized protein n=1 Tax=Schistosoma margrebowiei TaxID=48269 RepID=A0AA84ZBD7_9TREM|nr:unnamed protein product [Schistosoma margrebowiei]
MYTDSYNLFDLISNPVSITFEDTRSLFSETLNYKCFFVTEDYQYLCEKGRDFSLIPGIKSDQLNSYDVH